MRLVYGIPDDEIHYWSVKLGDWFDVLFRLRENDNFGGYYYRSELARTEIVLHRNIEYPEGEPIEDAWPIDQLILVVSAVDNSHYSRFRTLLDTTPDGAKMTLLKDQP